MKNDQRNDDREIMLAMQLLHKRMPCCFPCLEATGYVYSILYPWSFNAIVASGLLRVELAINIDFGNLARNDDPCFKLQYPARNVY
jgi:hypothetical protein